jgi:hypothetical protein
MSVPKYTMADAVPCLEDDVESAEIDLKKAHVVLDMAISLLNKHDTSYIVTLRNAANKVAILTF